VACQVEGDRAPVERELAERPRERRRPAGEVGARADERGVQRRRVDGGEIEAVLQLLGAPAS
jgi:hypothetical protein